MRKVKSRSNIKNSFNGMPSLSFQGSPFTVILKGVGLLSIGQISSFALSFIRNIILARVLTKSDFGIVAALATAITLFEFASKMSLSRQIVQDLDGESEIFQKTAQAFQFLGGICGALLVIFFSVPFAKLFHIRKIWWAFAALAFVPLFKGLENLDIYRFQRKLDYLPSVLSEVVSQFVATLIAYPVVIWLKDFRAFIIIALGRSLLNSIMSHVLAERRFHLGWEVSIVRKIFCFTWPLLVNGFLLFACQQADQVLVGSAFSLSDLAIYSISFSLVSIPWYISSQVSTSIFLPLLSKVQSVPVKFQKRYRVSLEGIGVAISLILVPLIIAGDQIVQLLYGNKYIGAGLYVTLMGTACAFRFLRIVPVLGAMAHADTKTMMFVNLSRMVGFIFAAFFVWQRFPLWTIAASAIIGEIVALSVAVGLLHFRHGMKFTHNIRVVALVSFWLMVAGGFAIVVGHQLDLSPVVLCSALFSTSALVSCYFLFPNLRREVIFKGLSSSVS